MTRWLRWIGFGTAAVGFLLGTLAMTGSPWLRLSSRGQAYGIRFSLVQDLVSTGAEKCTPFPTPTNVFFGWAAWILLGVLSILAVLCGFHLPRTEVFAGITLAGAVGAVALLLAACRPLESPGVQIAVGAWIMGIGYLVLGAAAVLGALSNRVTARIRW
jgi:hypothetical protein